MNITTQMENDTVIFRITGRIDTASADEFRASLSILNDLSPDKVVFDMNEVDYISSVGLRQILNVRKRFKENEAVEAINCNEYVMEVFETTGFGNMLVVRPKECDSYDKVFFEKSFGEMLDYHASKHPDKTFISGGKSFSYKMVEVAAKILAMKYMKAGIKKGSHVGLYGSNDANWIIHFFALQYIGAVTLLINPALKKKELLFLTQIGDITAVCVGNSSSGVSVEDLITAIGTSDTPIQQVFDISEPFSFDEDEYFVANLATRNLTGFDDPAVIIFSSGSTGMPKGVILSAYNVFTSSQRFDEGMESSEIDRFCLVSPLFHVVGLNGVMGLALVMGAEICIPKDIHIETIVSAIDTNKCTIMFAVPTILLAISGKEGLDFNRLSSLRSIVFGAAPMSEDQIHELMKKLPSCKFSTAYGLSEISPISISPYGDTTEHVSRTVGKPSKDIELKIINTQTGDICKSGESGEILARGSNLMLGYYSHNDLKIEDQAVDENDWLHTGDIGYITEGGYLALSGRIKEIIIRGGENIIPNEIAYALCSHENVIDAKVLGIKDDFYGETVAACIRLKDKNAFNEKEMNLYLSDKIAKYKIPSHYEIYDKFPLLSNGKIDAITLKKDLLEKIANRN